MSKGEYKILKQEEYLKKFEFFINDLKDETKERFVNFLGGDDGNHDIIPVFAYETVCETNSCSDCEWECTNKKREE